MLYELLRLADREDARHLKTADNIGDAGTLGFADENDLTIPEIFWPTPATNDHFPAGHRLPLHDGFQSSSKRIIPENSDHKRRIRIAEHRVRPLCKLREIRQERSLHLVLSILRKGRLRKHHRARSDNQQAEEPGAATGIGNAGNGIWEIHKTTMCK